MAGNQFEGQENKKETRAFELGVFLGEVGEKMKGIVGDAVSSEELKALGKEHLDVLGRMAVLGLLTGLEFLPFAEMGNDAAKFAGIAAKGVRNLKETKKDGKGHWYEMLPDLYPNISKEMLLFFGSLDAVGVPLIGVLPELSQLAIDQFWNMPKLFLKEAGEVKKIVVKNLAKEKAKTPPEVSTALAVFAGAENE